MQNIKIGKTGCIKQVYDKQNGKSEITNLSMSVIFQCQMRKKTRLRFYMYSVTKEMPFVKGKYWQFLNDSIY